MSKPDKPGELRDVELNAISLVTKAANGEKFKIFKSVKEPEEDARQAPEIVEKDERGLFHVLKTFFAGENSQIEKGKVADTFNAKEKGRQLRFAAEAFWEAIGYNRWGEAGEGEKAETDTKKIRSAIEDFKKIIEDLLLGKDADLIKMAAEIKKSGRKISGARLNELKAAHAALSKIIEETDLEDSKGEASAVTKEELSAIVKAGVDEGTKPLLERLEKLENADALEKEDGKAPEPQDGAKSESKPEAQSSDIAEAVKNAVIEATASLTGRLEKVEKARGVSNKIPEDTDVKKNEAVFSGVFAD